MSDSNYPVSLDDNTSLPPPGPNTVTNAGSVTHAVLHDNEILAIQALETKLGTGSSTSTAATVLRGNGTGTSTWGQLVLTTDVTGTLPVANGGTGITSFGSGIATFLGTPTSANLAAAITNETGSGALVFGTSPAITTPTGIVKGDVGLGNVDNTSDATKQAAFLLAAYPVGSIYINVNSTNPATLLGFGTWSAFAAGRTLIGVGTSDQAFTAGATGGESTHLLTSAESGLPAHIHPNAFGNTSPGDGTGLRYSGTDGTASTFIKNNTAANASSAHNNLQPYIVVYMWQRTA